MTDSAFFTLMLGEVSTFDDTVDASAAVLGLIDTDLVELILE